MINSITDQNQIVTELKLLPGNVNIQLGDARDLPSANNTIDGIITSPPYSIALDYIANDMHALQELGFD